MKTLFTFAAVSTIWLSVVSTGIAEEQAVVSPTFRVPSGTKTEQRIRETLAADVPYMVIFEDNTMREAVQYLADASKLPSVQLEFFSEQYYDFDQTRITLEMEKPTLEDVLNFICRKSSTAFLVEDSMLKFMPKKKAAKRFETVVYDLRPFSDADYPTDELPTVIQKTVAPGTWAVEGQSTALYDDVNFVSSEQPPKSDKPKSNEHELKMGTIALVPHGMVVFQSQPVQRDIEHLLQKLWALATKNAPAKTQPASTSSEDESN